MAIDSRQKQKITEASLVNDICGPDKRPVPPKHKVEEFLRSVISDIYIFGPIEVNSFVMNKGTSVTLMLSSPAVP